MLSSAPHKQFTTLHSLVRSRIDQGVRFVSMQRDAGVCMCMLRVLLPRNIAIRNDMVRCRFDCDSARPQPRLSSRRPPNPMQYNHEKLDTTRLNEETKHKKAHCSKRTESYRFASQVSDLARCAFPLLRLGPIPGISLHRVVHHKCSFWLHKNVMEKRTQMDARGLNLKGPGRLCVFRLTNPPPPSPSGGVVFQLIQNYSKNDQNEQLR